MDSRIAKALNLQYRPVAIVWSKEKPADAMQFEKGRWGCVMGAFGAVAERGRTAAFDRETFGCQGGGVGLGFGNQYLNFIGGQDGFCRFLSNGNERSEMGRAVAEQCAPFLRGEMREHFLHGEGYKQSPELVEQWIKLLPLMEVPTPYVLFKPLDQIGADELPQVVVFLANPDQMSALVVLANYGRPDSENAIIPHAAGCQSIGIFTYREAKSDRPRAVVGLNDLSARKYLSRLGKDLMTVSLPYQFFMEMEQNVPGSFLEKGTWKSLQE